MFKIRFDREKFAKNPTGILILGIMLLVCAVLIILGFGKFDKAYYNKLEITEVQYQRLAERVSLYPELKVMISTMLYRKSGITNDDYIYIIKQYEHLKGLKQQEDNVSTSKELLKVLVYRKG